MIIVLDQATPSYCDSLHIMYHIIHVILSSPSYFVPFPQVPLFSENLGTALSKLCWSPNGHYLACGDIEGKVHLFETGEVSIIII